MKVLIRSVVVVVAILFMSSWKQTMAQPTPTAIPIFIPTSTPVASSTPVDTDVPPTFTPTDQGPAQLIVPEDSGAINARAEPDLDAFILGQIRPGEQYVVTGTYFNWVQFEYESAPSGYAYVYGELVELIGDTSQLLDLTQQQQQPAQDTSSLDATQTVSVLQLTPGFDATQTAGVREIAPPSSGDSVQIGGTEVGEILPTFTYPPNVLAQAPTPGPRPQITPQARANRPALNDTDGITPMVPIIIFATLGVVGLLLSTLRR